MHLTASIFLLGVIDECVHVTLQGPIAARRVRVKPTPSLHRQVGRLLHRLDSEIARRLDDDSPLPTDPGDNRGPVFIIMTPTRFALLAATTRSTTQVLAATSLGLPLLPSRVIEVIRFHCALHLAIGFIGDGRIA